METILSQGPSLLPAQRTGMPCQALGRLPRAPWSIWSHKRCGVREEQRVKDWRDRQRKEMGFGAHLGPSPGFGLPAQPALPPQLFQALETDFKMFLQGPPKSGPGQGHGLNRCKGGTDDRFPWRLMVGKPAIPYIMGKARQKDTQ